MDGTKIVKAVCTKTGQYFALEVLKVDGVWKVVNVDHLDEDVAKATMTWIGQKTFDTHTNLVPCESCGSRRVGSCAGPQAKTKCKKNMDYSFQCTYCDKLKIDYSLPSKEDIARIVGRGITPQGKEIIPVTFSSVAWTGFDNVSYHQSGRDSGYDEPRVHVIANEKRIEFHGYNISNMDEGVYYDIGKNDDFAMECNVNTSTIEPHPGGYLYISFGILTAQIALEGGTFYLGGQAVATVGSRFKMRLCLTDGGMYEIYIDDEKRGECFSAVTGTTRIIFGFNHDSHHCHMLSHAYLDNIIMIQAIGEK